MDMWDVAEMEALEKKHGVTEAVYNSLLAGNLSPDDARKLRAMEMDAPRPCPDLLAHLEAIIAAKEA